MGLLIAAIVVTVVLFGVMLGLAIWLRARSQERYLDAHTSGRGRWDKDSGGGTVSKDVVKEAKHQGNKWFALLAIAPLAMTMLLCGSFCKVNANEVGIIYDDRNGILNETVSEGFHGKSIFHHITTISTANRNKTILDTSSQTKDGQFAIIDVSLTYKIEKENAGKFYRLTNDIDISDAQMLTLVKQVLQEETSKYSIFDLLSEKIENSRKDVEDNLREILLEGKECPIKFTYEYTEFKPSGDPKKDDLVEKYSKDEKSDRFYYDPDGKFIRKRIPTDWQKLGGYHITLVTLSFNDVDGGDAVENILKKEAEAEQMILIKQKEAEANMIQAESEAEIAKKKSEVTKTLAEAEAEAIRMKGMAEAEAANAYVEKIKGMIDNLYHNLNVEGQPEVVTYKECVDMVLSIVFYDTWDGKLPDVVTSDSLSGLIGGLITGPESETETPEPTPAP